MSKTDHTTDDDQHRAAPEGDTSSQPDTELSDADVWAEFDAEDEAKNDPDAGGDGAGDDFSGPDGADPDADAADGKTGSDKGGNSPRKSAADGAKGARQDDDGEAQGKSPPLDPEALQTQIEKLTQQVSSEEGRRRKAQRDAEKWRKRAAELRRSKQDGQDKPDETLEALRQDYPDMAPLADQVLTLRKTISDSSQERAEEAQEHLDEIINEQWGILTAEHPDASEILGNRQMASTLKEWVMDPHQPRYLQDIFEQNRAAIVDGTGAALLVSHFKAALAKADEGGDHGSDTTPRNHEADRRQRQLDGASASRRNKSPRVTRNEPPEGASPGEDWDYFERLDREKARQGARY